MSAPSEKRADLDHAALLRACAAGDRAALRRLYEHDGDRLFGIALRIVRDRGLARDAVRDGFVRIWRQADRYDPDRGSARDWISAVVRTSALNAARGVGRDAPVEAARLAELPDCADDPRAALSRLARPGELKVCLERLEADDRLGLLLAYVDGYSHDQIAARLKTSPGDVRARIRRSLPAIAERMP